MAIESFEQLNVWNGAHQLVMDVYRMTRNFPKAEQFGLVSQMRRAAVSVPANIAEGFKRRCSGEKARFYNIAESSLEELRYYLILSSELGYLSTDHDYNSRIRTLGRMLNRLVSAIRRKA